MLAVDNFRWLAGLLLVVSAARVVAVAGEEARRRWKKPIMLAESGGFVIGGKVLQNPRNPNLTLSCDHGYVEYFMPWSPRETSLVMWHSSSTQVWQNRWDGGEGFKDMFLRREYPVYLWDGPRVGRANWACNTTYYVPSYRDQGNFAAWNFGPRYPDWWPGVQFPTDDPEAWHQATSARYQEFDTIENVHLETDAAAVAADSGRLGENIVYLTNSAAGLRAQLTVTKSNSTNIKGLVMYESVGYVFPDNAGVRAGFGGFGPFVVPLEEFKKLAKLSAVQFVWGDHRDDTYVYVRQSRQVAALINQYGGDAEVLFLGEDLGLKGSTHSAFADMDNDKVADVLDDFLASNGLDDYA
ncbi:hypothetical protein QBC33DRAFT_578722 [Phialemonium atrogriseum]|uniref:Alpha/beta-hydrolase n=1 Tax=Phialemonium atrogriseum TaxID=1093897 RepID=A0AAJ0FNA6_9PEZI|nr:uncharacterized protein QBC33DRAFT_578722 [Phialemonium atrogriseum]KAK1766950.1 hypothetical protein QBC33DRAFT_578722 [Phialemonium atrogriseum]